MRFGFFFCWASRRPKTCRGSIVLGLCSAVFAPARSVFSCPRASAGVSALIRNYRDAAAAAFAALTRGSHVNAVSTTALTPFGDGGGDCLCVVSSSLAQVGVLDWMGVASLTGTQGFYWMAPIMSFSVIVGVGLDYDIFLLTRVQEYVRGAPHKRQ
jgi:hypothetical protein